jgi:hypothetical protein
LASNISAVASTLIALAALIFAVLSFRSQQARADKQQSQAEKFDVSSVRPILRINAQNYVDLKSLQLCNHGLGPAILQNARFDKDGACSTSNVVELFRHLFEAAAPSRDQLLWETFQNVWPGLVLPAQARIALIKESVEHLTGQGMSRPDALELLQRWQDEKRGIGVHIEYADIYGNEMEPLDFTFS